MFVEYWKRQELDLRLRWKVRGLSQLRTKRRDFKPEKEIVDEATGEIVPVFPTTKRTARQLLQLPFALLAATALGTLIATCFAIEIFISEIYDGPLKSILVSLCPSQHSLIFHLLTMKLFRFSSQRVSCHCSFLR